MNKLVDFLSGTKVLETLESSVNGKIQVISSFAFGTYIQVGGLTQTGGVVNDVWKTSLKRIQNSKLEIKNCLILGLGGGGNAKIVRQYWPTARITGVDLDPKMVEVGKKYFGLGEIGVKVVISDAFDFINKKLKLKGKKFDLILVDLYVGSNFPKKFENDIFPQKISRILTPQGVVVFNRLYYGEKRKDAVNFLGKLEKVFAKVEVVYPEANVMYICKTSE